MARPKKVANSEREAVTIRYRVVPYFAVLVDDPALSGTAGVGPTAKEALARMRGVVRAKYPHAQFDLTEDAEDIGLFAATSWKEPTFE